MINILIAVGIYYLKDTSLFGIGTQIIMVVLGIATFYLLTISSSIKTALAVFVPLGLYGLLIETLSITTGFPYSQFEYNEALGYLIGGKVPWTIFVIWPLLVLSSYFVARGIFDTRAKVIAFAVFLLVLFDLVFDPVALQLNFWQWSNEGIYYGVPLQNFLGWMLSGVISIVYTDLLLRKLKDLNEWWSYIYVGNLVLWTVLALFFGMYIPFLIGVILLLFLTKRLLK